jgi:hypothetical protein
VDFEFNLLEERTRTTVENINFIENTIMEKDQVFRELIIYILKYFAIC